MFNPIYSTPVPYFFSTGGGLIAGGVRMLCSDHPDRATIGGFLILSGVGSILVAIGAYDTIQLSNGRCANPNTYDKHEYSASYDPCSYLNITSKFFETVLPLPYGIPDK